MNAEVDRRELLDFRHLQTVQNFDQEMKHVVEVLARLQLQLIRPILFLGSTRPASNCQVIALKSSCKMRRSRMNGFCSESRTKLSR